MIAGVEIFKTKRDRAYSIGHVFPSPPFAPYFREGLILVLRRLNYWNIQNGKLARDEGGLDLQTML
jgi:hypothetical protein